ncbi:MAG: class I SAM-dependent methyltransferase [Planctomycetales bacterium]
MASLIPITELRSPVSGQPVELTADGKSLRDSASEQTWPIWEGIPRFVGQEHLASFGLQWNRYEVAHDDEDRATFQAKTGLKLSELAGLRILDAGCGGGRYSKIAGEAGAPVIGADHTSAVEKAARLCAHLENVSFIQADLKHLPLEPESFDFVFSIGVMHHEANTPCVLDAG